MRRLFLAVLCGCAAHAAVINGVVLDRATGRPLARSLVALRPVEGAGSKAQSVRANRGGQFHFTVSAGAYLLRATRSGFAPFQYGQRDWKSAGKPMTAEQDGSLYLDIRLRRYGAISGTVLDENEIGIPDQKVVAYPVQPPLQVAATAMTDDRGIYRIHGLEPGTYYVRAAAKQLEDGSGLLPTFHKETMAVDQSITVDVDLDQQADDVDIRPLPGKLFRLSGQVMMRPSTPVTVTLISDVGRAQTKTAGMFVFEQLAPGRYELLVEGDDPYGRGKVGAWQELGLDNDKEVMVQPTSWPLTEFRMQDEKGNRVDMGNAVITARRKTLDGGGRPEVLKIANDHAAMGPGRWEISVVPPPGYYAAAVSGGYRSDSKRGRADGWNEVFSDAGPIGIKLSSRPAVIHGVVTGSGHDPVVGAPVYLETFDRETQKRLTDLRVMRSDVHGQYRFSGLAPGLYRILSTFEYERPDSETMEAAGARSVSLSEASDTSQDLDLYLP